MRTFVFINFVFGFWILFRCLDKTLVKSLVHSSTLTKIGTLYVVWVVVGVSILKLTIMTCLILVYSPLFLLFFGQFGLRQWREKQVYERVLPFVNNLILQMQSGTSFRESFLLANEFNDPFFMAKMREVFDVVVFSQHLDNQIQHSRLLEVVEEFRFIDNSPHNALQYLKNLRQQLTIEADFRRRSGQVLLQSRLQGLVMTGLYIALLIFMIHRYGWESMVKWVIPSLVLFVLGGVFLFKLGRKMKWKV